MQQPCHKITFKYITSGNQILNNDLFAWIGLLHLLLPRSLLFIRIIYQLLSLLRALFLLDMQMHVILLVNAKVRITEQINAKILVPRALRHENNVGSCASSYRSNSFQGKQLPRLI